MSFLLLKTYTAPFGGQKEILFGGLLCAGAVLRDILRFHQEYDIARVQCGSRRISFCVIWRSQVTSPGTCEQLRKYPSFVIS